jgi:hypothetical protein
VPNYISGVPLICPLLDFVWRHFVSLHSLNLSREKEILFFLNFQKLKRKIGIYNAYWTLAIFLCVIV